MGYHRNGGKARHRNYGEEDVLSALMQHGGDGKGGRRAAYCHRPAGQHSEAPVPTGKPRGGNADGDGRGDAPEDDQDWVRFPARQSGRT